jgi:hypothetical protein
MDVPLQGQPGFRLGLLDAETCQASKRDQRGEYTDGGGHPEGEATPSRPHEVSVGAGATALLVFDSAQLGRWTRHACESPDNDHVRVKGTRQRRLGAS